LASVLKSIPIFKNLTDKDFERIEELIHEVVFPADHVLFRQGDPSDAFYIIKKGAVRIVRHEGGETKELAALGDGEFFGEIGVIQDSERTADVVLKAESTLLAIEKNEFQRFMAVNPAISMKIMSVMAGRYRANTEAVAKKADGEVVGMFSATGGVGNSFVTANLGVAIHELTRKSVCILDLDLMFGDQSGIFDVHNARSLAELHGEAEIDFGMVSELITPTESGVHLLQAPPKPEEAELVSTELIKVVIELLETQYDYILLDTANSIQDLAIMLLEGMDRGFYVCTPEFLSVKNAHRWLKIVEMINISTNGIELVLNKNYSDDPNLPKEIEKQLKKNFFAELPYDYELARTSLNKARPLVKLYPDSEMATALRRMAAKLTGAPMPAAPKKSFWGSLFKG